MARRVPPAWVLRRYPELTDPTWKAKIRKEPPLKEWKIVRGDTVEILTGKDKGKQGKVIEVIRPRNSLIVEGLNAKEKYMKPIGDFPGGYYLEEEQLHVSEVALVDPVTKKTTDVAIRFNEQGHRVRVSKDSGRIIPKPPWERRDFKVRSEVKDGDFDTSSSEASKRTYIPSLLRFHEEVMKELNVPPTIPKTEPDKRDLIMDAIRQDCEKENEQEEKPPSPPQHSFIQSVIGRFKFW